MSNCRQNYIFSFYLRYFSLKKYHFSPLCRLPLAQMCLLASPCDANDTGENALRRSGETGKTQPSRTLLSAKGLLSPDDMAPFAGRYGSFRRMIWLLSPDDSAPFAGRYSSLRATLSLHCYRRSAENGRTGLLLARPFSHGLSCLRASSGRRRGCCCRLVPPFDAVASGFHEFRLSLAVLLLT